MVTTISFRTEETKRDELDQVAKSLDRDRSYVINQAIENYLELSNRQTEQIEKGIRDAEEGRTITTEQTRAQLKEYMSEKSARK